MSKQLHIQFLKFKAGNAPGQPGLSVNTPPVTVIVGPNNSGKSKTLKEIESWCKGEKSNCLLIEQLSCSLPKSFEEAIEMLKPITTFPSSGQTLNPDQIYIHRAPIRNNENIQPIYLCHEDLKRFLKEGNSTSNIYHNFVRFFTLRLDGRTRFELVSDKPAGKLENPPQNHLWALFIDDVAREKIRQFTEEAFGLHFVIDPTGMHHFRVRLSNRMPETTLEEQAVDMKARLFHQNAGLIEEFGDGICAAVGLASAVMAFSQRILLIDEPEAFLHPTLARKTANFLSKTARERRASLIIATHSSDFLMGCIQNSSELCIIRLTNFKDQPTARSIAPEKINDLIKDPLIRSVNALRALFHQSVIVTESDTDRAFYEEINHRLLQNGRGISDCFFINAQNWQTISRIIAPLREIGIPAAAIFDFDVLFENDFEKIWSLLYSDKEIVASLKNKRNAIMQKLSSKKDKKSFKAKGVESFDSDLAKTSILEFLDMMAKYGIFFVPIGELEQWLSYLVTEKVNKKNWLPYIFERMGFDNKTDDYVHPDQNDVWEFIDKVNEWISNPDRLGIPI